MNMLPTLLNTFSSRCFLPSAALLLLAAAGAAPAVAQVNVSLRVVPQVISFSPTGDPVYVLFMNLDATGFANDVNPGNIIRARSGDGSFQGETFPGTGAGGSSSIGFGSIIDLADGINNSGTWMIELYDATLDQTDSYSLSVSTSGIPAEYLRTIVIDALPDVTIDPFPSFNFGIDFSSNSDAEYDNAFAGMFAQAQGNSVFSPSIQPSDTSWTPDGPLADDLYLLDIQLRNDDSGFGIIESSTPEPVNTAPSIGNYNFGITFASESQVSGLRVGEPPALSVSVSFEPDVISFSPLDPPVYILGIGINASGFTDDSNLDNFVRLQSANNLFSGDIYPARFTGSGTAGSIGLSSALDLTDAINSNSLWTLSTTDGVTGVTSEYELTVTTLDIPADAVRPITLDVNPGDSITDFPTFNFTLDPAQDPQNEYTSAFAVLFGTVPENYVGSPSIAAADRSWTPNGPLAPDTYIIVIGMQNPDAPDTMIDATQPVATSSGAPSISFNYDVTANSFGQVNGLVAAPFCVADFDQNGGVDGEDVAAFFEVWTNAGATADVNQSGGVDGDDVEAFFVIWTNGGC